MSTAYPLYPSSLVSDPERLAAVRRTALLGTPTEESFDRMTRLAVRLIGVPVSFFSLVSDDHDFFKSCVGFPDPLASTRRFEGRSFCHYSLLSDTPMRVTDARTDDNLRTLPAVVELGVVAYLGIPLKLATGEMIGSLCAVDFEPHDWTEGEVEVLQELAASALREVELRMAMIEHKRVLDTLTTHLRDPLTIVQLNVDLLEESETPVERSERIARMRAACARMESGVRQCLHANRAQAVSDPAERSELQRAESAR